MTQIITDITKNTCKFKGEKVSFRINKSPFKGMIRVELGIPENITENELKCRLYDIQLFANTSFFIRREEGIMLADIKTLEDLNRTKSACAWSNPCEQD